MLTEEQNRYVSDQVYLLDSSRADKDKRLIENKILIIKIVFLIILTPLVIRQELS